MEYKNKFIIFDTLWQCRKPVMYIYILLAKSSSKCMSKSYWAKCNENDRTVVYLNKNQRNNIIQLYVCREHVISKNEEWSEAQFNRSC